MLDEIKFNLYSYLHKDEHKKNQFFLLIIFACISILYYSINKNAYNVYTTNAQVLCEEECKIQFYYQIIEPFQYDFIKINEIKYEIDEIILDEIMLDTLNNGYQNITLKVKEYKGNNNEIVKLQVYKNKETMFKKIKKIIVKR